LRQELKAILGDINLPELQIDKLKELVHTLYDIQENKFGPETMRQIEKMVYLRTIDMLWVEHLTTMDELRTGIGLRGYGQRDPLVEYKQEAYVLFESLQKSIENMVAKTIFKMEVAQKQETELQRSPSTSLGTGREAEIGQGQVTDNVTTKILQKGKTVYDRMKESKSAETKSQVRNSAKVGRNDPCPCGSGKKYKKCCGK
jgi:preprotein translocase subunit SecA